MLFCVSYHENLHQSVIEKVKVKSRKYDVGWRKNFFFDKVARKTSFLGKKGGREGGCQAVPLIHLTAVQNDSWRLWRRHHGWADVAAAFQVQQHFFPPLSLSLPLIFFYFFSSSLPSRKSLFLHHSPYVSLQLGGLSSFIASCFPSDCPFNFAIQWNLE